MTITHLAIRNFQSLRKVDLDLGTFTVIVGPSSSGKSAVIRAFRALASNVRGTQMITRGQKQLAITATTDTHTITLERGERSSGYRLLADGTELIFTKLAGDVPEHVTNALRLDPGSDSVNFAGQFDKPYLLDESGSTIARQLGELTNVNAIFEAVREANRIRGNAASTLKTRKNDLEQLKTRLADFTGLPDKLRRLADIEQLDQQRRDLTTRINRLTVAARTLRVMEEALAKAVIVELPDTSTFDTILRRHRDLASRIQDLRTKQDRVTQMSTEAARFEAVVRQADQDFHDALTRAGVCPTCGQRTSRG